MVCFWCSYHMSGFSSFVCLFEKDVEKDLKQSSITGPINRKLLLVVVHRLWHQINSARVVTESENHGICVPKFLLAVIWGPWICILSWVFFAALVSHAVITDWGQFNSIVFYVSGMARSFICSCKWRQSQMRWFVGKLTASVFVVTWSSRDYLDQSEPGWHSVAPPMCQCQAHPCWSQRPEDVDASRFEYGRSRY